MAWRALAVGPAAAPVLARAGATLEVHSVFAATANLRIADDPLLVALAGPRGVAYPHAVVLDRPRDFAAQSLAAGDPGRVGRGAITIRTRTGDLVVDLTGAAHPPARPIPAINRLAHAHRACAGHLERIRTGRGSGPGPGALAGSAPSRLLGRAARSLGEALEDLAGIAAETPSTPPALARSVAGLIGLGPGLTPAGDDFLCGLLAAARGLEATGSARVLGSATLLRQAVTENLARTGDISATLLRGALAGHWPAPLVDLATGLARDSEEESLQALAALCCLGHSSGADMAAGFLAGLEFLSPRP